MATQSINAGENMSAMFTTGVVWHANIPHFDKYMENTIETCKIKMAAWYVYGNQWISKRPFEDKYFHNMME